MTYQGKHYSVVEEKNAHGRAWVVVGPDGQDRLFFDREKANEYAARKDAEVRQERLF